MELNMKVWKRGSQRAPHKPLLLLLAMGSHEQKLPLTWAEVELRLKHLLTVFGGSDNPRPEYPFIRLQTEGIWKVEGFESITGNARVSDLRSKNPSCGLTPEFQSEYMGNSEKREQLIDQLLAHVPQSDHSELLSFVGLRQDLVKSKARKSSFRPEVLSAYSQKCAVCGYGSNIGMNSVGLDAAHIQWHGYGGPDEVQNGIALCSLHHRLFDRGAFTITTEFVIQFSSLFNGSGAINAGFQFHGQRMNLPFHQGFLPGLPFIQWHQKEVFRGEVAANLK